MNMGTERTRKQSRLIRVLREGVAVVQMIFFKELRSALTNRHPDLEKAEISMLAGAITNELFGTPNPEAKFVRFSRRNRAVIEQELLGLAENLPHVRHWLTDALRVQVLCDHQEGLGNGKALVTADKLGLLLAERDIPLPSAFMKMVRKLGEEHGLLVPPVQFTDDEDRSLIH